MSAPTGAAARPRTDWLADPSTARSLRARSARGASSTVAAQAWRFVLQLTSTVALARLLGPESFGLVGMVLAVTALADQLKDLGLGSAVVQRPVLTQAHVSALFWINVGLGAGLAAVVVALAPALAAFYGEPSLTGLTVAVSVTYVLGGLGTQHSALLLRQLRFRAVATRDAVAQTVAVAAALAAAAAGAGTWSLVLLPVVAALLRTCSVWVACDWRPSAPRLRVEGLSDYLVFGGRLSAFSLLNHLSRNADNLLVGRFSGAAALGAYGRAYALVLAPVQAVTQPLTQVLVPTLSRLVDQPDRFRRAYLDALSVVAVVSLPGFVVLAVVGDQLVSLLLGPGWERSGEIFALLVPTGIAHAVTSTCGWLYLSTGATRRLLRWALWTRPLTVAAFVVGIPWGPEGVAAACSVVACATAVPSMVNAAVGTPLGPWSWVSAVRRPAALAAAAGLVALVVELRTGGLAPVPAAVLPLAAGLAVHAAGVLAWPALRELLRDVVGALRGPPAAT